MTGITVFFALYVDSSIGVHIRPREDKQGLDMGNEAMKPLRNHVSETSRARPFEITVKHKTSLNGVVKSSSVDTAKRSRIANRIIEIPPC